MEQSLKRDALQRLQSGDDHALGELFPIYRQRLLHIIHVRLDPRLATRLDAEDVLQEVYLDAAARIQHFVGDHSGSFFVWLRLITMQTMSNLYRRHLEAQKRSARRDISIDNSQIRHTYDNRTRPMAMQLVGQLTSPSKAAMREETIQTLELALADLKPMDREAITLRHFELLENKEAAEVLGITEKAASIRYIRAMRRLKTVLKTVATNSAAEE